MVIDGTVSSIEAPCIFESDAEVRKVLYIEEDMLWTTVHVTEETDLNKLEELLIEKSPSYLRYTEDVARLKLMVNS